MRASVFLLVIGLSVAADGPEQRAVLAGDQAQPAADIKALLKKGGKNWLSPYKAEVGKQAVKPGERFWIWPAEDRVYEHAEGKPLAIRFHWAVPPGQPSLRKEKDEARVRFCLASETLRSGKVQAATALKGGRGRGTFEIALRKISFRATGQDILLLFLQTEDGRPLSNLIFLKMKELP